MKKVLHVNAAGADTRAEEATSVLKKGGEVTEAAEAEIEEAVATGAAVVLKDAAAAQVINPAKVGKDVAAEDSKEEAVAPVSNHMKADLKDAVAEVPIINHAKEAVEALKEKAAVITNQEKEKAEVHLKEKLAVEATIEAMLLRNAAPITNPIPHQAGHQKGQTEGKEEKLSLAVVMHRRVIAK